MYIEISFVSLQQAVYFSSRLLNLFRNDHAQCLKNKPTSFTSSYNLGHNILRLFDVLPNFPFTISETNRDY